MNGEPEFNIIGKVGNIKDAYKKFNEWFNKNPNLDKTVVETNWYTQPVKGKVYTK